MQGEYRLDSADLFVYNRWAEYLSNQVSSFLPEMSVSHSFQTTHFRQTCLKGPVGPEVFNISDSTEPLRLRKIYHISECNH